MKKFYVGIDNGVSGSIGIINTELNQVSVQPTPVKKELNYTKEKAYLNRIDRQKIKLIFADKFGNTPTDNILVALERPMVNPKRWKASVSAIRALESTITIFEDLDLPFIYIDSKEWQKDLLPKGTQGEELKEASLLVARRLFPNLDIKDGDGILIAEWARRKQL
jgi:hypothetical protein